MHLAENEVTLRYIQVLPCEETWYGVTYREDLDSVKEAIANMKKQGIYTENLWD